MEKSSSIASLAAALVKAQANIGGAVKGDSNPFFKSRYAGLGEVIAVCKAALLEQGIAVAQMPCVLPSGAPGLETILVHSSGEWMSGVIPVVCAKQNDPQALGSSYTYVRRYALQSALLIPAVDDDGEAAMFRQGDNQQPSNDEPSWDADPHENDPPDFRQVAIHFGKLKGVTLAELKPQQLAWWVTDWMPSKENDPRTSPDDRKLVQALKDYSEWQKNNKQ